MVTSLNLIFFNTVLSSGKRKKSHGVKSGEQGKCGMTSRIVFYPENYAQTKQSQQIHCHGGEMNPPVPFFRSLSPHIFPQTPWGVSVMHVALQFVFVEQIHNAQLPDR
jgi:hypothetical protein